MSVDANAVTIQDVLHLLRLRYRMICACMLLGLLAGGAIALLSPEIYRAEVLLSPVSQDTGGGALAGLSGSLGGLASLAGVTLGETNNRSVEALATLQSRALTDAFVSDKNLLPVLFPQKWDSARKAWKVSDSKRTPTLWDANELFSTKIRRVVEDKKTGLITLAIDWTDPSVAAEWVTELVARTNSSLRARAIQRSERNVAYLQDELNRTSIVELRQAIFHLVEREIQQSMLAKTSSDYAFKVIDPAVVPKKKIRPKRLLITAAALFVSLLISVILALIMGMPRGCPMHE